MQKAQQILEKYRKSVKFYLLKTKNSLIHEFWWIQNIWPQTVWDVYQLDSTPNLGEFHGIYSPPNPPRVLQRNVGLRGFFFDGGLMASDFGWAVDMLWPWSQALHSQLAHLCIVSVWAKRFQMGAIRSFTRSWMMGLGPCLGGTRKMCFGELIFVREAGMPKRAE